jgi:hypothetical protein
MNISSIPSSVFNNVSGTFGWLASKPRNTSDVLKRMAVLAVLIIGSAAVFAGLTFSGGLPFIAIPVIAVASSLIVSLFLGSYLRPGNDDHSLGGAGDLLSVKQNLSHGESTPTQRGRGDLLQSCWQEFPESYNAQN